MSRTYTFNCLRRSLSPLALLLAVLTIMACRQASAAVPTPTGFTLQLSPYGRVLDAIGTPEFMDVLWEESCDNPHLRVRARNKPALMLTNHDSSAAPITSFTLGIDASQPFLFGTGDFVTDNFNNYIKNTIYTDAGVTITGSSISPDGQTLTVDFDGLTAGKKVIFNVDLDAEDPGMFPFPDYRMVLYGAPETAGDVPTPTGTYGATFTDSGSPVPNSKTLGSSFDQMTETPSYHDLVIRPYDVMDKVEIITQEIPEPSGLGLALAGAATLALRRRGRR